MESEEKQAERLIIQGPEFLSTTRFGSSGYAPLRDGESRLFVQRLNDVKTLQWKQLSLLKEAVSKSTESSHSVFLSGVLDLESDDDPWIAWECADWPPLANLLSGFERSHSRGEVNLVNLSRLFREIADALDRVRKEGWESPFIELNPLRIYVRFGEEVPISVTRHVKDASRWPPFDILLLPFSLDHLFPIEAGSNWHERPLLIRFAGLVFDLLGGKTSKDGIPRVEEYKAGIPGLKSARANTVLRSMLRTLPEDDDRLRGMGAREWIDRLIDANVIAQFSGAPVPPPTGKRGKPRKAADSPTSVAPADLEAEAHEADPVPSVGEAIPLPPSPAPKPQVGKRSKKKKEPAARELPEVREEAAAGEPKIGIEKRPKPGKTGPPVRVMVAGGLVLLAVVGAGASLVIFRPDRGETSDGRGTESSGSGNATDSGGREEPVSLLKSAEQLRQEGKNDLAVQRILEAIEATEEGEGRTALWEKAYEWKSVKAAFHLATLESDGDPGAAARRYREAADWFRDGVAQTVGEPSASEEAALEHAAYLDDGDAFYRLGKLARAAELNDQAIAAFVEAARVFENGSALTSANMGKAILTHQSLAALGHAPSVNWLAEFYGVDDPKLAAEQMERAEDFAGAAKWWMVAGDTEKAVELWLKVGDVDSAAGALTNAGLTEKAAQIWIDAGNMDKAANVWVDAGQVKRAVALWTGQREWQKAVDLLVEAADFAGAAKIWEDAGELEKAAEVLVQAGRTDQAGELLIQLAEGSTDPREKRRLYLKAANDTGEVTGFFQAGVVEETGGDLAAALANYETFRTRVNEVAAAQWDESWAGLLGNVKEREIRMGAADSIQRWIQVSTDSAEKAELSWQLHQVYQEGNALTAADPAKAVAAFGQAVSFGHPGANYQKATELIEAGDQEGAMPFLDVAARAGNAEAGLQLGNLYMDETVGGGIDTRNAAAAYSLAADLGKPEAMNALARLYADETDDVTTGNRRSDLERAAALYQQSAGLGNPDGMFGIAQCYLNGLGVEKDIAKAKSNFQAAADNGSRGAANILRAHPLFQ